MIRELGRRATDHPFGVLRAPLGTATIVIGLWVLLRPRYGTHPIVVLVAGGGLLAWMLVGVHAAMRVSTPTWAPVTAATRITLARGSVMALLLGYAVLPGVAAGWFVAVSYAVAALLDIADGALARATNSVSPLGSRLDTEADGLTVLTGSVLVVSLGVAPLWFLAVGAARYVFVVARAVRRYRGRVVIDDETQWLNRGLYILVVVTLWLSLLPVSVTIPTQLVSAAGTLYLVNFCRSWLVTAGYRSA